MSPKVSYHFSTKISNRNSYLSQGLRSRGHFISYISLCIYLAYDFSMKDGFGLTIFYTWWAIFHESEDNMVVGLYVVRTVPTAN